MFVWSVLGLAFDSSAEKDLASEDTSVRKRICIPLQQALILCKYQDLLTHTLIPTLKHRCDDSRPTQFIESHPRL